MLILMLLSRKRILNSEKKKSIFRKIDPIHQLIISNNQFAVYISCVACHCGPTRHISLLHCNIQQNIINTKYSYWCYLFSWDCLLDINYIILNNTHRQYIFRKQANPWYCHKFMSFLCSCAERKLMLTSRYHIMVYMYICTMRSI